MRLRRLLHAETEQACLERAWDLKERESTLEAKQQRLDAICAGMKTHSIARCTRQYEAI